MQFQKILDLTKNVLTTVPVEEKKVLYKYASKVPENGVIVDIGTAAGNSAFIMALASKDSVQVWTIDPIENQNFLDKRTELGLLKKVHFIAGTSNDAVLDWGRPIDLLFIDGEHAPKFIMDDINNWGKFVRKGSTVLLHDYFWYGDYVQKAIDMAEVKLKLIDVPFGYFRDGKVGIAITKKL